SAHEAGDMITFKYFFVLIPTIFSNYALAEDFFEAIAHGNGASVKSVLLDEPNFIDCENGRNQRPLHVAVESGQKKMVALLIEMGADVNGKEQLQKDSPLHIAATKGFTDIAEILILKGSSIDEKNFAGLSALHLAAFFSHKETAELLLRK